MKRDTKIVLAVIAALPTLFLGAATLCTWAIARGASMQWRVLFRILCHGIPSRCLELFGAPMPLCARCVGIYGGMLAGIVAFCAVPLLRERVMRAFAFAAATPLAIDGLTQLFGLRESTNPLRLATGAIAGLAFGLWVLSAIERRDDGSSHVLDLT
ncbi:MAG TPA: DUF2085 domain-containing protein [Thermoanaerobaculia bacterium]|jgi:uncharacterized membrane protein|nr:DUF2085 domain-containing protein [Thermoanaerobaculia bacterium]